jgi:hypothetical protein
VKFLILGTCLVFGTAFPVMAQTLGLRLGGNLASQTWELMTEKYHTHTKPGINLGVNLNLAEIHPLSTQLEFRYSQLEFSHNGNDYSINYVKLGCVIKGNLHKLFNIHVGPEIGFQVIDKQKFLATGDFGIFAGVEA